MTDQEKLDHDTLEATREWARKQTHLGGIKPIIGYAPGESPPSDAPGPPLPDPREAQREQDRIQAQVVEAVEDLNRRRREAAAHEREARSASADAEATRRRRAADAERKRRKRAADKEDPNS
jgi:hypothetical protein